MSDARQAQSTAHRYRSEAQAFQPRPAYLRNALSAYLVGGLIAVVGQLFTEYFLAAGLPTPAAGARAAVVLVVLGALLTGLGWYDKIARFGGAGAAIPVTGFANSVVAPAMEAVREGTVMGTGAQLFTVAGPVLTYGVLAGVVVALLRWWLLGG
ncbi:SpoVA/SpoVAEb family sporulation membrane protein [Limnochorda pilosa]|uniref:SpoVA/SpoVAEb family sporulation membrane protein n=1 Tax=Limnochorda pilosa TaxID=1555112 RepID=UPI000A6C240F|nr:SpoVA/SpoVAEb family sporulation membrane protein [Limnochorda pilosa]